MTLKDYRKELGITINEASNVTCVPLRTYIRYEKDETYGNSLKREQIFKLLKDKYEITEEKGILSINEISKLVSNVLKKYNEVLSMGRCRIFYKYENRNASFITDEFADKLIKTLPYTPVKGIYDGDKQVLTNYLNFLKM